MINQWECQELFVVFSHIYTILSASCKPESDFNSGNLMCDNVALCVHLCVRVCVCMETCFEGGKKGML